MNLRSRYEGPLGSSGAGAGCGAGIAVITREIARGGATAIAIAVGVKLGACGDTASWRVRWHARIDGCVERDFE